MLAPNCNQHTSDCSVNTVTLPVQKACTAAGFEYEKVIDQTVVWEAPDTAADGAAAVKQDGEDATPPAGSLH